MQDEEEFFETPEVGEEDEPEWRSKARFCIDAGALTGEAVQAFERFAERAWATPKIVEWIEREHARAVQWTADKEMLEEVMGTERLSDREQEAFSGMYDERRPLTPAQRSWLEGVAARLEEAAIRPYTRDRFGMPYSPVSPGSVEMPWEKPGYEKPTKPPGRNR